MIYHYAVLLVLPMLINAEPTSTVWFGPDVIIPDLDETLIDKKPIRCPGNELVKLSNLGLEEIPRGIVKSKAIKSIILDNNEIRMVKSDEFDGTPNLECLSISNNSVSAVGLKLKHAGLKTFIFDHQSLSNLENDNIILHNYFPQNTLEARFPNVKFLSWRGINYNFLDTFLTTFPKVTTIDLADSDLTYIDKRISTYAPNLKTIHLERNSIDTIDLDQFEGVHELYLDKNPINAFFGSELHNLTVLSLSGCFDNDNIQIKCWSLQSLDLSNNRFSQLMEDMFDDVPNLKDLNLSHNKLVEFPDLSKLQSLRKLSLSYNGITSITDIFASPLLRTLNLRGNEMTSIEKLAFSKHINLEVLDLSENRLAWLPQGWGIGMVRLRSLNLSSNRFNSIESMEVFQLTNLLHLYVKNNDFSSINSTSLRYYIPNRCTVYVK